MANLELDPIEVQPNVTLAVPDVEQLTTSSITGTGVFDKFMAVVKLHLLDEYNNDRITGDEYSKVYLGALSAVMQQSIAFLTNHQNSERIRAEIGLVRQKTVTELAQTDELILAGLGFNDSTAVEGLVALEKLQAAQVTLKTTEETDLITAQELKVNEEKALIISQELKVDQEALLINSQELKVDKETLLLVAQELKVDQETALLLAETGKVTNEKTKIDQEVAVMTQDVLNSITEERLLEQKIVTELSNTSDVKPQTLGEMDSTSIISGLAAAQVIKTASEWALLDQKKATELAQIQDLTAGAVAVAGVIGKQKALFQAQTDGFTRDAEQKAAKLMVDAWSVSATMGVGTVKSANRLDDPNLGAMLDVLLAGANVTPIP